MRTKENMNMSEMMNFDRDVVNYINDNKQYIKEWSDSDKNESLAKASLDHYTATVIAYNSVDEYLSDEQEKRFYEVALRLFTDGHVANAGFLND